MKRALPFAAFVAACILIILRQPSDFTRPQFFADDGVFFQIAFNEGSRVLLPYAGYWNTIPGVFALLAAQLPMHWAPLMFAAVALLFHAAPIGFLFTSRCAHLGMARWPLALAYIALPETRWLNANLCHVQWHLPILGFLIVVVAEGRWKWFDRMAMAVIGTNGVFCLFLLPIARRNRMTLAITSALQVVAAIMTPRPVVDRNAGLTPLIDIASNHIVIGSLVGPNPLTLSPLASLLVALCGGAVVAYALAYGPSSLRRLWALSAMLLVAVLIKPPVDWAHLAMPGWAQRYWFVPALAFLVTLIWMAGRPNDNVKALAGLALCPMLLLLPLTWRYSERIDYDFAAQIAAFEVAPRGTLQEFRFNPPGWTVQLNRR